MNVASRSILAPVCAGLLLAAQLAAQQAGSEPSRAPVEKAWDLLAKGQNSQAVALLHDIINTTPNDADARLLLGSILAEAGERSESIAQLSEAVRLRPLSAEAHNALGEAMNNFGQPKSARSSFEKAIALDATFVPAHVNLAQILIQAGEFDAAAKHLDLALRRIGRSPDAAVAHYLRAKVNTEHSETQQAVTHLTEAVALRPDFGEAWSDLGQARKGIGDNAGALAAFQKAVAAAPDDAVAQYRLGSEYLQQGQVHLAIAHLQKAQNLSPEDQSTLYALQNALRRDGQPEVAAQVKNKLAELLRQRDKSAEDALIAVQLNNQGARLEKDGNLRGAVEKYRAALELCPEHVGFRVNFAAALLRLGDWSQGIAELRQAAQRDPANNEIREALERAMAHAPADRGGK